MTSKRTQTMTTKSRTTTTKRKYDHDDDNQEEFHDDDNNNNYNNNGGNDDVNNKNDHDNDHHENNTNTDYQRPRRPNEDTIQYLISLPLDLQLGQKEIQTYIMEQQQQQNQNQNQQPNDDEKNDKEENENIVVSCSYPDSFHVACTALWEIKHEMASIACGPEQGGRILEILFRLTIPYSNVLAKYFLSSILNTSTSSNSTTLPTESTSFNNKNVSFTNYYVYCATHRYGSHVVQTLLETCCCSCYDHNDNNHNALDLALHPESPILPQIQQWMTTTNTNITTTNTMEPNYTFLNQELVQVCYEIQPYVSELAIHVCGSHFLRTLFCTLGGVKLVQQSHHQGITKENNSIGGNVSDNNNRGKIKGKKKKKKKKFHSTTTTEDGTGTTGTTSSSSSLNQQRQSRLLPITNGRLDYTDSLLYETLLTLTNVLTKPTNTNTTTNTNTYSPGRLQEYAVHSSASPLLVLLLQILTYRELDINNAEEYKQPNCYEMWEQYETNIVQTPNKHLGIIRKEPYYRTPSSSSLSKTTTLTTNHNNNNNNNKKLVSLLQNQYPAHELVQRILCWSYNENENHDSDKNRVAGAVLYGLAGEARGSHLLEMMLRCCPDNIYEGLLQVGQFYSKQTVYDYIVDPVSNYIIQTILSTLRSIQQIQTFIISTIVPYIQNGYLLNRTNQRLGIVWRTIEIITKYYLQSKERTSSSFSDDDTKLLIELQRTILDSIQIGYTTLLRDESTAKATGTSGGTNQHQHHPHRVPIHICLSHLLNIRIRNDDDDETTTTTTTNPSSSHTPTTVPYSEKEKEKKQHYLTLDVPGTRSIYYLLRFDVELLQEYNIVESFFSFSLQQQQKKRKRNGIINDIETLLHIIQDPFASRCLIDGIIELATITTTTTTNNKLSTLYCGSCGNSTTRKLFYPLVQRIVTKLTEEEQWTTLALHRVGYHTVRKLFETIVDYQEKEQIVSCLIQNGTNRLHGNNMGKQILECFAIREYQENGYDLWCKVLQKKRTDQEWLQTLSGTNEKVQNNGIQKGILTSTGTTATVTTIGHSKEGVLHDNVVVEKSKKGLKKSSTTSIDSIFASLTNPISTTSSDKKKKKKKNDSKQSTVTN